MEEESVWTVDFIVVVGADEGAEDEENSAEAIAEGRQDQRRRERRCSKQNRATR